MADDGDMYRILLEHLHDPSSSFSIGSFGAIAEFHRDPDEPLTSHDPERLTIVTARGALRINQVEGVVPLAYETLSGRAERWQQGVVFCLPEPRAESRRRSTLTELGLDRSAIRAEDRDAVLFDMGLCARNVDFCIRTSDPALLVLLRQHAGRSLLSPPNRALGAIVEASPHRIAISSLGRAEVYQAIGKDRTPEGPHTHVLPKLLKSGRTHSANIPVPQDTLPCLSLHPANPLFDGLGRDRPFDRRAFARFQSLLERWGLPEHCAEKARVLNAMDQGEMPAFYDCPETRLGRTALRIALRQAFQGDDVSPVVTAWRRTFEPPQHRDPMRAPKI